MDCRQRASEPVFICHCACEFLGNALADGEQSIQVSVFVLMIDVGVVRMGVGQPLMLVAMSMRFAGRVVGRLEECSCS
jgi:hypothetical protein